MSNKLPQPELQLIKLHKNSNGMGLSIVAAKGAGQEKLGIYIKSVVPGGAADADGRLQVDLRTEVKKKTIYPRNFFIRILYEIAFTCDF